MKDILYVIAYYVFRFIVISLPKKCINVIIYILAHIGYFLGRKYNKIAKVNLDLAFENRMEEEEKNRIIKKCYFNLLHLVKDSIINQTLTREELLKKVTFHNEEIYTKAISQKKGVVFLTAHYGNWELSPLAVGAKFGRLSGIGRNLDSPRMNTILIKSRENFNVTLLEKKGALRGILKALHNGENVGLLVDQNTSRKSGILISFFNKLARHTPAAAQFAYKTNSLIIPVYITTNDYEHYDVTFYDPIDPPTDITPEAILENVQKQANITQKIIEQKPDEWFWFHKRWKNQYESLYTK